MKNIYVGKVLFIVLILLNFGSLLYYASSPSQKREQWREAVSFIEQRIELNEIVLFSYPEPFAPYRWYEKNSNINFGGTDSIYANRSKTIERTSRLLEGVRGVYYFEYLKDISDPFLIVLSTIQNNGFKEIEKIGSFEGIGHIYYLRK